MATRRKFNTRSWIQKHLFSSPFNTCLTIIVSIAAIYFLMPIAQWAIFDAAWQGEGPEACHTNGACWVFVRERLGFFIYGRYPPSERWRIDIVFLLLALLVIPQFFSSFPWKKWFGIALITIFPLITAILMRGGYLGLTHVETDNWGGFTLTLILAFVGIIAALPLGILMALGRRSTMPIIRTMSIAFIEFWRGVPLITVLFMASVMLPLFFPEGITFDKLIRALIGIVLFESAYLAEVVRGGLQGIPKGQFEAAAALGLNYWKSMTFIILPQALRMVIPGIVNTFISLFKDTALVGLIGLTELLEAVKSQIVDPTWPLVATEGLIFAALIYWIFCFGMSRYSVVLERQLETRHRR